MAKTIDMTKGSPSKHILSFAIPLLLGNLFQQFYNVVDTIIIGKYLGKHMLASVGATGSINFMVVGMCLGICSGFGIPIAQRFGARDYKDMRRFISNATWLSAMISAIVTTTVCIFCDDILKLMKTPSDIIDGSYRYIFIIFAGIPTIILYNMCSSIIRSLGDSKTPLYFLIISSLLNIGLDLLLVKPMGIAGPAVATVVSQGVSGLLCLFYMRKKYDILHMSKEELFISPTHIKRLLLQGIPMGIQYSITAIGSVILQTAVNELGSLYVASVTAAGKISMFFACPFDALGSTAATYSGQNIGAGKPDRISKGLRTLVMYGAIYSAAAFFVLFFAGGELSLLFMDEADAFIKSHAHLMLKYNGSMYLFLALVNIVRFLIQGMGYSILAVLAGVFEMFARGISGFVLVDILGYRAVCMANPLAWIAADTFLIIAYLIIIRREKRKVNI
ncbi:MAG: MATE family efflux transporter [Eubacterium sp.]|nr:MATE family efflux transporter [Eubacterium sp.]